MHLCKYVHIYIYFFFFLFFSRHGKFTDVDKADVHSNDGKAVARSNDDKADVHSNDDKAVARVHVGDPMRSLTF